MKSFGTFDDFKCFDVLGFQFYCDDFVGGGGGSGGGGGAGRSWPEDSYCKNDAGQIIDCEDMDGVCYEFITHNAGPLPVTKKTEVPCKNGASNVCYDDDSKIIDCHNAYNYNDRMCWYNEKPINIRNTDFSQSKGDERFSDYIDENGLYQVPCNDLYDCFVRGDDGLIHIQDCNTAGRASCYAYDEYPMDVVLRSQIGNDYYYNCITDRDYVTNPLRGNFALDESGEQQHIATYLTGRNILISPEYPRVCYDSLGFKVDCDDLTTILKIPRETDIPYIYPNTVEVPPLDCDICQFLDECMSIFNEWTKNFWTLMAKLYDIESKLSSLDNISQAVSQLYGLAGFTQGFFPQVLGDMMALITDIKDLLKDFNITLPDVPPVNPEEPPSSNLVLEVVKEIRDSLKDIIALLPDLKPSEINFSDELFKLLKEIKKTLEDLKMEIIEEAGTSFWDFLGGLFGDIFELIEFLIEKIIYLVVPEDSSFITTSLSGLSDALSDKFEPMDMLKDSITSSLKFEEKEFEKLTVDLPVFGNVQFFDPTYINMAIPKLRQLISGMMVLFTAFWAYRKITTEMIK